MNNSKQPFKIKKFSELTLNENTKTQSEEENMNMTAGDLPMNPNLSSDSSKREVPADTSHLMPKKNSSEENTDSEDKKPKESDKVVETFGKIARFPKGTKASKAYNFLENVKVPKKSIWYMMIEKQDNELQMVKYNVKEGVDLNKFVNELKDYYINHTNIVDSLKEKINNIEVGGNEVYSSIRNIPLVEVGGKKMITKITEDLINLLND